MHPLEDALFITRKGTRITKRAVQDMVKKIIKRCWFRHRKAFNP
jgi:site-specific recombinase XerC